MRDKPHKEALKAAKRIRAHIGEAKGDLSHISLDYMAEVISREYDPLVQGFHDEAWLKAARMRQEELERK